MKMETLGNETRFWMKLPPRAPGTAIGAALFGTWRQIARRQRVPAGRGDETFQFMVMETGSRDSEEPPTSAFLSPHEKRKALAR